MRLLFLVLLSLLCVETSASAQDEEKECESYRDIPVTITPRFDEPTYDYSTDLTELQRLAKDPIHNVHGTHKGLTLGLTRYEPLLEFRIPVKGVKFSNGLACAHVDNVDVSFGYKNVVVYVPREVPQGSCGFNQVMAHEQKHIDVNQQILAEYTPLIKEKLAAFLKANGVFREQDPDYALSLLKEKLQSIINEMGAQMTEDNVRRQQLVDSPEEYRRVSASCNGQLSVISQHYMQTGH
jgi:hypothetical protein